MATDYFFSCFSHVVLQKEFSAFSTDINSVVLEVSKVESSVTANKEILIQLSSKLENISKDMTSQHKE